MLGSNIQGNLIDFSTIFFQYLGAFIFALIISYAIGRLVLKFANEFSSDNLFIHNANSSIIIGFVILVSCYALICTKGKSIMMLTFVIIIWFCISRQKTSSIQCYGCHKKVSNNLFISLIYLCSYFLFFWLILYKANGNLYCDFIYYGNVCFNLNTIGVESADLQNQIKATPYHWGELWFTALWAKIFGFKELYSLCLITYPFLFGTLVLTATTLVKIIIPSLKITQTICLVALLFCLCPILGYILNWGAIIYYHPKQFLPTLLMLWSIIFLINHQYTLFAACSSLLAPLNSVTAAGVFSFAVLMFSYILLTKPKQETIGGKRLINHIFLYFLLALLYLAFYFLQPKPENVTNIPLYEGSVPLNIVNYIIKRCARPVVLLLPISIICCFVIHNKKECFKKYLSFTSIILASCFVAIIAGGIIRQFVLDGGQIATMYYEISCILFIWISIIYIVKSFPTKRNRVTLYLISATYAILAIHIFNSECYNQKKLTTAEIESYRILKQSFSKEKQPTFGYIVNYNTPLYHNTMATRCMFTCPMNYIANLTPSGYFYAQCLSVLDMPDDIEPRFNDSQNSQLYKFAIRKGLNKSKEEIILDFIKEKKINYVILTNGATLPDYLKGKAKEVTRNSEGIVYYINL